MGIHVIAGPYAILRLIQDVDGHDISLNRKYGASRRFDLVRILADHLVAGEDDVLLPGTPLSPEPSSVRSFSCSLSLKQFLCPSDAN